MIRDLAENQTTFWYQTYQGEEYELDDNGRRTGEKVVTYSNPIEARAMISANTGNATESPFGANISYDKSISTVQKLPIDEYSRLFIDTKPVIKGDGSTDTEPDYKCVCPKLGLIQNVWAIKKIRGAIGED